MSSVLQDVQFESVDTGAPIVLITGLPGAAKTLYAVSHFLKGQPNVFQHGVNGCSFPEWDATKWSDLAPGSTLVVDEAQEVFPPRNPTSDPPPHYVLNKIRHGGRSIVLITQDPGMLDSRVRRLVGRHIHLVNAFGSNSSMVYDKRTGLMDINTRESAESKLWPFPVDDFKLYKSTVLNRKKRHIPKRILMIPVLVVLAIGGISGGLYWVRQNMADKVGVSDQASDKGSRSSVSVRAAPDRDRRPMTVQEYAASLSPRVAGLPHTAPRYDSSTKPVKVPYPAACLATASRCNCYTQDATPLAVDDLTCRSIVAGGFFKDWQDAGDQRGAGAFENARPIPTAYMATPAPPMQLAGVVQVH